MEYRILGPVEVRCDSHVLPLGGPKVRTLLAVLLLHANQVVPAERLVDDLWGDGSPISARNLVQGHVSHLRATLVSGAFGEPLTTLPGGYLLRVAREEFDLFRFEDLVQSAEAAMREDDIAAAAEDLRAALAFWRGPALAGVSSRALLERARPRLEEQRLSALEERIAADLRLGRHQRLVGELRELIASEPLRERLRGQLMTALYGSGRRAQALQEYRAAQEMLASELGVEPSPELQRLEQAIRGSDPTLVGPRFALPVPSQLPPDIADFTGSSRSLEVAERLLASGESGAAVMATVVISGPAGIGKTTVAVHVAHQLHARFPDGQLFADLGGAEIQAADSGNVLARFLRALGVHGSAIPADLAERAALYRARLADRRVLVVLDNVASEVQVRPLLPGGAGCAVLITSRRPLGALQGAAALPLTVLDAGQAVQLLAKIAGRERIAREPEAAQAIVELTGGLPLAVRICGARLASRPQWRVTKLAQRLQDERGRLDELKLGDLEVRASLALSYQGLDEGSRRAFGLLGVLDAADFPVWLAAGALGAGIANVEGTVDSLVDAGLLEEAGEDRAGQPRYRFHSLVRAFARECLLSTEPAAGRKAALARALTAQLSLGELARSMVAPGDAKEAPSQATPRWQPDSPSIVEQVEANALEWLEAERTNLIVATRQASQADLPDLAWELACVLPTFLALRGYWQDWRATKELALEANRKAGNRRGEAHMLWSLGESLLGLRDIVGARTHFSQSLALYRAISDSHGERHTLLALGFVEMFAGNLEVAFERLDSCRLLCAKAGERHSEAVAQTGLAGIHRARADNVEAAARLRRSLGVFQEDGDRYWEATVLRLLGEIHMADGLGEQAATCFEQALKIFRDFGDRYLEGRVLYSMAELQLAAGRGQDAAAHLESCVAIYHELNLGSWQARALKRLQDAHRSLTRA